jgi:hypothetical protein
MTVQVVTQPIYDINTPYSFLFKGGANAPPSPLLHEPKYTINFLDRIDRIFRILLVKKNPFQSLFRVAFDIKRNSFIFISNGPLNLPARNIIRANHCVMITPQITY